MTITAAERAEISRQNSRRSTGPKSPLGKSRSCMNALKHGCRAKLPVLPGEDPDAYRDRLDSWTGKFDPRDPVEAYLVERAVNASWQLDRADRAEVAELMEQIDKEAARRVEEAAELGARLFRLPGRPLASPPQGDGVYLEESLISWPFDPDHRGYPAHLVAALEATAAGCCWLLEKWAALGTILEQGRTWQPADRVRAIRLMGKQPLDAIGDDGVRAIYLACQAMDPEGPDVFAEPLSDLHRPEMEAQRHRQAARFATARAERSPRDAEAGRSELLAVVAAAMARVSALREVRTATEAADRADIMARLPYSTMRTVEWLHKHQVTCGRTLYRAIDELRRSRRDFTADPSGDEGPGEPTAFPPCDEGHGHVGRATEESEVARVSRLWLVEHGQDGRATVADHGQDGCATEELEVARASSPWVDDHGQDGCATEEVEVARAPRVVKPRPGWPCHGGGGGGTGFQPVGG